MHASNQLPTKYINIWRFLPLVTLLLGFLLVVNGQTYAQTNADDLAETEELSDTPAPEKPAALTERPFNTYERFSYETGISNQLQKLMSRYLNSSIFHISVQVDGRMVSNSGVSNLAGGGRTMEVTGRQNDKIEEDKVLEMLPALPFFSSRIRAPINVEATEASMPESGSASAGISQPASGPYIDRIRVYFVVDTAIDGAATTFYKGLISSALRLDGKRGDEIVVSQTAFPAQVEAMAGGSNQNINVQARMEPAPTAPGENNMLNVVSKLGKEFAWMLGGGLAGLGILIFIGLIWRGRKTAETSPKAAVGGARDSQSNTDNAYNGQFNAQTQGQGRLQLQTDVLIHNDQQEAQLKKSDPLLNWLINEREILAFAFERLIRNQGDRGVQKMVMLLHRYEQNFIDMLAEFLEPATREQLNKAWETWNPEAADPRNVQHALDELTLEMHNQEQFGNFPFIIYLKDKEILELLQDEEPLRCLMVLDGLAPNRKSVLLNLFGPEKTAQILSSYAELSRLRFEQYANLSTELFAKLKKKRESSENNDKAYEAVLATVEQQPLAQQESMMENFKSMNEAMYNYIRERIMLWSDVPRLSDKVLRDAVEGFDSEAIAALLRDDAELQARVLPFRPTRERLLIRDLIAQGTPNPEQPDEARKRFLQNVKRIFAATSVPTEDKKNA
jgi:flagellar motor switch protein FliG